MVKLAQNLNYEEGVKNKRRFVVLGGAGTIGKVVVRDLFESHPGNRILVADYNKPAAESLAKYFKDRRVQPVFVDARQPKELAKLMAGQNVAINCLQHNFNLAVMEAALSANTHYVDLGGLFSWTRKQLRLHKRFRNKGLSAIIGMGCAPGITNVLAAYGASQLKQVRVIKIRVGSVDFNPPLNKLCFPYSAQTIIEELTLEPWIFDGGQFQQVPAQTGWERTQFPDPVGKTSTVWTRHSEVATLPLSFRRKGLRHCDFKVSFDLKFVKEVMTRLRFGWTIQDFNSLVTMPVQPNDYEISRVMVDNLVIDCHAHSKPGWQASAGDVDTGCPPSIVAQMIASGAIKRRGVVPPEIAVPIRPFLSELEKRGMKITTNQA